MLGLGLGIGNLGKSIIDFSSSSFFDINRNAPSPDVIFDNLTPSSTVSLSGVTGLDAQTKGVSIAVRLSNTNWQYGANEMLFWFGDANNYIYFQKRKSGRKLRWGLVSQGTLILIQEFSVDHLYDAGHYTIGATVNTNGVYFTLNGLMVGGQETNVGLPIINTANQLYIGRDTGGSQIVNSTVAYDWAKIWVNALSLDEIENATYEYAPLSNVTKDGNLWITFQGGQSNSHGDSGSQPNDYTYSRPSNTFVLNKDLTKRVYADPNASTAFGNQFPELDRSGSFNALGVVTDEISRLRNKDVMAVNVGRGGVAMVEQPNVPSDIFRYVDYAALKTAPCLKISQYTLSMYLFMVCAWQYGVPVSFAWYQGESDAMDRSGDDVTTTEWKTETAYIMHRIRNVLPNIKVMVGLADQPATGYQNWSAITQAQSDFVTENPSWNYVSAQGLHLLSDDLHLSGVGQRDLGLAMTTIINTQLG
jgi:hypothetical protein